MKELQTNSLVKVQPGSSSMSPCLRNKLFSRLLGQQPSYRRQGSTHWAKGADVASDPASLDHGLWTPTLELWKVKQMGHEASNESASRKGKDLPKINTGPKTKQNKKVLRLHLGSLASEAEFLWAVVLTTGLWFLILKTQKKRYGKENRQLPGSGLPGI